MTRIKLSRGESLIQLMVKSGQILDTLTGIWLVESGSLQKIAVRDDEKDNFSALNLYVKGDYLMGDSDIVIDYIALDDSLVVETSLSDIDPMRLFYQIDAIEELQFVNSHKLDGSEGRFIKFIQWASKKLGREIESIPYVLTQSEIGKFIGVNRVTVNRKLQGIKKLGGILNIK